MKLRCLLVDDEPLARNLLSDYVGRVPYLELTGSVSNPLQALTLLRETPVDLLFLDIQMPELTGLELLKSLRQRPMVILTTAYSQYALQGYEFDVLDYLLKPIMFERFLVATEKAWSRVLPTSALPKAVPDFVFVKDGTKMVRVELNDILYVEGMKDYVTIHTRTQKIVTLQRLKSLEEQLPPERFMRIHHSFIVALKAIDVIHRTEVQIGTTIIPVSESYRKAFKQFIDRNQITPEG